MTDSPLPKYMTDPKYYRIDAVVKSQVELDVDDFHEVNIALEWINTELEVVDLLVYETDDDW